MTRRRPVTDRIRDKVLVDDSGCWIWQGSRDRDGYGYIRGDQGALVPCHRAAYMALVGEITPGLQLDHLCRVRACCNPEHLEPVTIHENSMRSTNFAAVNSAKTHCKRGHAYSESNTYLFRGRRQCRACQRAAVARYAARKASAS